MRHDSTSLLVIETSWDGEIATASVTGELDITTAPALAEHLEIVAQAHPEGLVLDLDGLMFVDVAGARALDRAHQALEAECPVLLRGPQPSARKVFRITGLLGACAFLTPPPGVAAGRDR